MRDKVTLGGDIAVAAGPKGRSASAETTATMRAEILTYSRSRGLFAGVALKGAVLRADADANKSLYKRSIEPKDLLTGGSIPVPEPATKFIDALGRVGS
jgi:lipid-binding SYLF domain-containing protein